MTGKKHSLLVCVNNLCFEWLLLVYLMLTHLKKASPKIAAASTKRIITITTASPCPYAKSVCDTEKKCMLSRSICARSLLCTLHSNCGHSHTAGQRLQCHSCLVMQTLQHCANSKLEHSASSEVARMSVRICLAGKSRH